ncbi:MAG TPA: heparinase II/III family protein, partial [Chitinophagaceae bacterium]|nr:heparinase II/III family protein [Chitinophagaceae bacterium]
SGWFNLIHNHAVWACAGVGIVGVATDNKDYVDMALYGTKKDSSTGFIALMNGLFSPDGYYTEGPYYVRYAILPYYVFAIALNNSQPQLKIFEHRNRILQKALLAGLQQTNLNGAFFAMNDALKEKDFTSNELVTAVDVAWEQYGRDSGLLVVAKKQNRVILNNSGVSVAAAIADGKNIPDIYSYRPVEYTDGAKGNEGGISLMRIGKTYDLTTLIYKYTSHGLSHGHYDKLNYNLYDKGNEILTDYGAARFIGVEQKYGGRYLPETKNYAAQTIAHNTIVVDEKSHFDGKEAEAEKFHSQKLFSSISNPVIQVVAAKETNAYKDVQLQRTVYLLQLPDNKRLLVDIFKALSNNEHQYDLPFHYNGHLISTSLKYEAFTKNQQALGTKNGYQFLWKEAEAWAADTVVQLTFLNHQTYYTISSLADDSTQIFFSRSGANDPNFNLRHEPSFIIRKKGKNQKFVNVTEIHGKFDPVFEFSTNAYSSVKNIKLLQHDEQFSIAEIMLNNKKLIIAQHNKDVEKKSVHSAGTITWTGPFAVFYDGKKMN